MAVIGEKQLNEQLKKCNISPIYFIYGDDHFLIKNIVEKIVKLTVTNCPEFNYNEFKLGATVQEIYDCEEMMPLMSDKKCVSVCDFNFDKCNSSEFDKMLSLLEQPNESTVLIFWFETVVIDDKKKSDRLKKVLKLIEKNFGTVCSIGHRTNAELISGLRQAAIKRGCSLDSSVANYMLETCGRDLFTLQNEIEKICYYSNEKQITKDLVDKICSKTIEASIFNLSKMILAKNVKGALDVLNDLYFMNINFGVILFNLSQAFIDIVRVKSAIDAGVSALSIAGDFGYNEKVSFRLTNSERSARYMLRKQTKSLVKKILDCEKTLKSSAVDDKLLLEKLVVDLIVTLQRGE